MPSNFIRLESWISWHTNPQKTQVQDSNLDEPWTLIDYCKLSFEFHVKEHFNILRYPISSQFNIDAGLFFKNALFDATFPLFLSVLCKFSMAFAHFKINIEQPTALPYKKAPPFSIEKFVCYAKVRLYCILFHSPIYSEETNRPALSKRIALKSL